MLKRFAASGVNLTVLLVAVLVFIAVFIALNWLATSQRPATLTVLAAARDIPMGDVINASDLVEKTVYADEDATLYIPVAQADGVLGGVAALPIFAGQPLLRNAVIAQAGEGFRLSAALAGFSDHSLFPLPLDANNVVAPEAASFLPGDRVGVTVVIGARPQPPATPTAEMFSLSPAPVITPTATLGVPDEETALVEALDRSFPPLAKDLFPQGLLVIAVQGLPSQPAVNELNDSVAPPVLAGLPQPELLLLLVPNKSREQLALALQRADQVYVFLLARGEMGQTAGFTYWDFEDLFKSDREKVLKSGLSAATPGP